MESIPMTAKSLVFFTYSCGGWTHSSDSKKPGILYLLMWRMNGPIPATAREWWYSLLNHVDDGNNSNDCKKARYSLHIHVEDGTSSNNFKMSILYLFMRRMESIPTTAKSMVKNSLLNHVDDGTNSNDCIKSGILYLFMFYGPHYIYLFNSEKAS